MTRILRGEETKGISIQAWILYSCTFSVK